MKFNWWKVGFAIVVLVCLGLVGKVVWDTFSNKKIQDQLNEELMQGNLELGKAHTQLADASEKIKELTKKLQAEIKAHKETVTQYNELWAKYDMLVHGNSNPVPLPGHSTVCGADNLTFGNLYLALNTNELLDFGNEIPDSFSDARIDITHFIRSTIDGVGADIVLRQKFDYQLHLNIKLKSVTTIAPTGAINNYAELYEVDKDGKELGKFTITKFESVVTDQRKARFRPWAPHLDLGLIAGVTTGLNFKAAGSLGFSVMGYGLTDNDLSWRFIRVGVNFGKTLGVDFSPALWNLGGPIPLVSNLWIAPFVSYDLDKNIGLGLSLSVVL